MRRILRIINAMRRIPAIVAPIQPRLVSIVTRIPAITTPIDMVKKDLQKGRRRTIEIIDAVQAPVPGSGIAVKIMSPVLSYLSTMALLFWAWAKRRSNSLLKKLILLSQWIIVSRVRRISGTGRMLPTKEIPRA